MDAGRHARNVERINEVLRHASVPAVNVEYELSKFNAADIADAFEGLAPDARVKLIKALPDELGADIFSHMEEGYQDELLDELDPHEVADLVAEMEPDEAADVLEMVPAEDEAAILEDVATDDAEQADAIRELRGYPEDSAGGLMTTDFVSVSTGATVGDALAEIKTELDDVETLNYVYVTDEKGVLADVVTIRELMSAPEDEPLSGVERENVISVDVDADQEEVARVVEKYDFAAIPVVDSVGVLRGIVTHDDVLDVVQEEADEDIRRLSGTVGGGGISASVPRKVAARMPWLYVTLGGELVAAFILAYFEASLRDAITIMLFVPLIMATAGATGNQSSMIIVRAVAIGDLKLSKLASVLFSEASVAVFVGLICGLSTALIVWGFGAFNLLEVTSRMPFIIAISMTTAVMMAGILGTLFPIVSGRLGIDPALAAGPFITTVNDVLGLLVYLAIATSLLKTAS